jgi:hypothetical protein
MFQRERRCFACLGQRAGLDVEKYVFGEKRGGKA